MLGLEKLGHIFRSFHFTFLQCYLLRPSLPQATNFGNGKGWLAPYQQKSKMAVCLTRHRYPFALYFFNGH